MKPPLRPIRDILSLGTRGPVRFGGWVRTRRSSKKVSFLEVNDGSTCISLQVVAGADLPGYEMISGLTTGCSVEVEGLLVESPGAGQALEVQAAAVGLLGAADPETYPLQKKEMSFEYLRDMAPYRVRTGTFSSVFRIRSRVSQQIHQFLAREGFEYVHTPVLTQLDAEGAGETFQVTSLDLGRLPRGPGGGVDYAQDFFGAKAMLCVTGQLEAELLAMGLGRVYTFGPTFRAENSNTSRHLAEFWMIEPEMAFWDLEQTASLAQNLIRFLADYVLTHCAEDLAVIAPRAETDPRPSLRLALEKDFVRATYSEAVSILLTCGAVFEQPVSWGMDLKSEHERYLCERHFQAPTFVTDYPAENKAFYMYLNDDKATVRAMDLLVPGIGEVVGGSQREDREDVLRERMAAKGIHEGSLDWYLGLRRYGSVPHSGFGLGLERLLMWLTGMGNIRDVIPFPRFPGSCRF